MSYADRPYQDRAGLQHWFKIFRTDLQEKFVTDQIDLDLQRDIEDRQPFEYQFISKKVTFGHDWIEIFNKIDDPQEVENV